MATIVVVGAASQVGAHIATKLRADGHRLHLVVSNRSIESLSTLGEDTVTVIEPAMADKAAWVLAGADAIVIAATTERQQWVKAAIAARCPLVDVASEQQELADVWEALASLPCVVGAGLVPGITELLINATLERITPAIHTVTSAYTWPDRNFPPAGFSGSQGRRLAVVGTLQHAGMRLVDGLGVNTEIGERRQPVWFPRPVGPQFALAWPSVSWFTLPQRISGLRTSEHFVVVGGWRSEILQALSNLARGKRGLRWLTKRAHRSRRLGEPAKLRWACVAELHADDAFWRAWAYGHDPYQVSAEMVSAALAALLEGKVDSRQSFASMPEAEQLLDDLTASTGLRWSVSVAIAQKRR